MLNVNSDAAWERYGQIDPYFGVLAHERYRSKHLDAAAHTEFFRTGEAHVDFIFQMARKYIDSEFCPARILDFGCGVGRLIVPMSRFGEHVVGVDVSEAMLKEATENCLRYSITNVRFVRSDDRLSALDGKFDFIHSFIVFQHIPPSRGMTILQRLLEHLEIGGVGALHFTYARKAPITRKCVAWMRRNVPLTNCLINLVQGKPWNYPLMQMHNYSLDRLVEILNDFGCRDLFLHQTDHGGHLGTMLFFRKGVTSAELGPVG